MLLVVEQAVRAFPSYHKYSLGTELRRQSMYLNRLMSRAALENDPACRAVLVERLAEQAVALGKQSGGWWKRVWSVDGEASRMGASPT